MKSWNWLDNSPLSLYSQ